MSNLTKWLNLFPGPAAVVADDGRILAASKEFCKTYIGNEWADPTAYDLSGLPLLVSGEGERILDFLEKREAGRGSMYVKAVKDSGVVTHPLWARRVKVGGRKAHIIYLNTTPTPAGLEEGGDELRTYYRIAESSSVVGILYLENGRVSFANPYVETHMGYSAEELQGLSPLILFPPEERVKVEAVLKYIEKEEMSASQILKYKKKSGGIGWATFSFSTWREEDKIIGAIIFFDISEKMELRDRLEIFKNKLQATISTMPDIFLEVSPEGEVVDISAPIDDPLYALKEKDSEQRASSLPPDFFDFLQKAVEEVQTGKEESFIYRFKFKGIWRYYEAKGAPAGKNVIFIFRNITDRIVMKNVLQSVNRVSKLLLKAEDEKDLCQSVVKSLSDGDIIRCLWIGVKERGEWKLMAAHPSDVLNDLFGDVWEKGLEHICPHISSVLDARKMVVVNRLMPEPCPHFQRFWNYGKGCELLLPMLHSGEVVGLLALFMEGVDEPGGEDIEILQAMANDLAFAIRDIEDQRRLKIAYRQLKENLVRFEKIADKIRNPLMVAEGLNYLFENKKIDPEDYHRQIKEQLKRIEGFLDRLREEEERSYIIKEDLERE
ncbi:hypothetical protein B6U83_01685 [Thermoplasmatales archaeon ex4484_36]|nr:MAG: hypothetical protein B6U83_01685 [Thermoplasmatales archaeon ex4484_36]